MSKTAKRQRRATGTLADASNASVFQTNFINAFIKNTADRDYTPYSFGSKWKEPAIQTKNGVAVKVVVGKNNISRFYFSVSDKEKQEKVKEEMILSGFTLPERSENATEISIEVPPTGTDINTVLFKFWEIVEIIEKMGDDFVVYSRKNTLGKQVRPLFLSIARHIYVAWKDKNKSALSRAFGLADDDDKLMAVGYTRGAYDLAENIKHAINNNKDPKTLKKPYREHAVPVSALIDSAIDIFKSLDREKYASGYKNLSADQFLHLKIYAVAKMFQRNLVIVYTDKAKETDKIDAKYKTTMPSGWDPYTGDVLERFKALDIPVYPITGGHRLAEEYSDIYK